MIPEMPKRVVNTRKSVRDGCLPFRDLIHLSPALALRHDSASHFPSPDITWQHVLPQNFGECYSARGVDGCCTHAPLLKICFAQLHAMLWASLRDV